MSQKEPIKTLTSKNVVVRIENLSKRFVIRKDKSLKERLLNFNRSKQHKEDFYALSDINLDISKGSTVGLIGANGSGKSTLLKMISGVLKPTHGRVLRKGRIAALLELGAGFHPDLTGRENVYLNAAILGLSKNETDDLFEDIVAFSEIEDFIDTQVKFYSSGMYVRLAFSVAIHVNPELLIVDEVLAVGDEPFQRKCLDRIKSLQNQGKTIILVSHALEQVGELCDRVIVLEKGHVQYDGEPSLGIQILREGFERVRMKQLTAGLEELPHQITKVSIVDPSTGLSITELTGNTMKIIVGTSSEVPTKDLMVGIGIETPLGHVVYGTNNKILGKADDKLSKDKLFTFDLSKLNLGAGSYIVHASLGTVEDGELFRIAQAGLFSVSSDHRSEGSARFGAKIEIS